MRDLRGHQESENYKQGEKSAARCFLQLFDEIRKLKPEPLNEQR
jgi:hypothetical protein